MWKLQENALDKKDLKNTLKTLKNSLKYKENK